MKFSFIGVKYSVVAEKSKGQSLHLYLEMEDLVPGSDVVTD